ncbi:thylakoid lumenal 16.5 kDa protein, chloroplastic-like [Cornus florida]|uniref:thylakoid lumenal 16.5 kDa protein, chloroplastic-like n=1 Tax=Cornus florida TaxID=4283 RepID=UPI00289A9054|nr:thylakoid lumenal 16.5 kDa protein, chloroplastic-like [Cornus florida]XP_059645927.1 thylakoid lumenal 16.5 kDa protein, chloroplastic-like [Cornus florida]
MATVFFSTANTSLLLSPLSSSSSSSSLTTSSYLNKHNVRTQLSVCKAVGGESLPSSPPILTKRSLFTTAFLFSFAGKGYSYSNAAILEADDDEELMEKVKKDRKKRIERQGVISSSKKEKEYLQDLVFSLDKVGQALENNDLPAAGFILGLPKNDTDWIKNVNEAFAKLSSSPEEKMQVDIFNSSLVSLIQSVVRNDVEASKIAFVSTASAFEKWTALTGLNEQLKGL